jgi:hypothetical protein
VPRLRDAYAAAAYLNLFHHITIQPGLLHVWATRGHIQRHGYGPDGKVLYDIDEVIQHIKRGQVDESGDE